MVVASVCEVNAQSVRTSRPWLRAFWQRAYRENVTGLSAMVAYNLMLAVFPFALLVLFVFGQVLKIGGVETSVLDDLQRLFPNVEQHTLTDVLDRIEDNSTTIGIAAFLGSLWIGASFWGAMDTAFCRIYHVECRGWVEQKRFSFAMLASSCSSSPPASSCRRSRAPSSPAPTGCPSASPTSRRSTRRCCSARRS